MSLQQRMHDNVEAVSLIERKFVEEILLDVDHGKGCTIRVDEPMAACTRVTGVLVCDSTADEEDK